MCDWCQCEQVRVERVLFVKCESEEVLTGARQRRGNRGRAGYRRLLARQLAEYVPDSGEGDTLLWIQLPAIPDQILWGREGVSRW